jgi:hypothetical protein
VGIPSTVGSKLIAIRRWRLTMIIRHFITLA